MKSRKKLYGTGRVPITENTGNGVPSGLSGQLRLCRILLKSYQQAVEQLKVEGSTVGQSPPFLDSLNLIFRPIEEVEVKVVVTRKGVV